VAPAESLERLDEPGASRGGRPAASALGLVGEHLAKSFGGRSVVDDVSVEITPGEVVGLLGPNGAGKTTSFHLILGLIPPNRGRVLLDGSEITRLPMFMRARRGVGYLPQEASIFRRMTVEENLLAVLELHGADAGNRRQRCDELIKEFGLTQVQKSPGYALSGGERRRAEIARALASDPRYMMLDEPFARGAAERKGHRCSDHGPQRARNFTDYRSRLYYQPGSDLPARYACRAG
jgi:LPS export ABC transporter ATP-binding protein